MNVSKTEAAQALDVIARSGEQMLKLKRYTYLAPFLLLWGLVWAAADATSDLMPRWSAAAWLVGSIAGLMVSVLLSIGMGRRARARVHAGGGARIRSFIMLGVAICCFFPAMYAVLQPLSARQANAFVSLIWVFAYMFLGAWVGWRLFTIGAIAAAAIVFGYLAIHQHYYLWMAVCGGGALVAGGLWLRKI